MKKEQWQKVRLGDVAEIIGGGTPSTANNEYWGEEISWITPKDLTNHTNIYIDKGERSISKKGLKESSAQLLPKGTVLLTTRAPIGYVVIASTELCTNQGFKNFIVDERKLHNLFLFYWLKGNTKYLQSIGTGTTFMEIPRKRAIEIEIPLPPLPIQRAIAETLSCLDDKIALNNRINANFEAQAQAIFKSWFVDFEPFKDGKFVDSELGRIPKGWRVGKLEEVASITMGQSPDGSSYNEFNNGTVFYQGRAEFGWRFPKNRLFTTQPKRMAKKGDVLMSVRAPVGDINVANEDCCIGRGLAAINSENHSFILYLMKFLKRQMEQYNNQGTVFGCINKDDLNGLKIIIPSYPDINKFNSLCSTLDKAIFNSENQSRTLTAIRDALLPKLMSGELEAGKHKPIL